MVASTLYWFAGNSPLTTIDPLGLQNLCNPGDTPGRIIHFAPKPIGTPLNITVYESAYYKTYTSLCPCMVEIHYLEFRVKETVQPTTQEDVQKCTRRDGTIYEASRLTPGTIVTKRQSTTIVDEVVYSGPCSGATIGRSTARALE
jgi:hypothetical protein